jgi:hypothetical protein
VAWQQGFLTELNFHPIQQLPRGSSVSLTKHFRYRCFDEDGSARLVFPLRRRSGLVEGVGLRDIRGDRGLFVVVRLEFLCLLERVRLGDGLGFLAQTSSLFVLGPRFVGHGHSLAALRSKRSRHWIGLKGSPN